MQMTPQKIADTFVGMAARAPNHRVRADILRRGAATFAGMASDPNLKSERARNFLTHIGLEFAGASAQAAQSPTTSDFTQLLRDTAQAWEELGPEGAALTSAAMNAQALQAGIANANNPGVSQSVSIAPASFNGSNVTLGRSVQVCFAPTTDQIAQGIQQSQTVAFWQGSRQEAQAMSIDFGTVLTPVPPQHFGTGPNARPYAMIQYGSDGNTQNAATLDLGLGRRITVVGNYISVIVGMDPPVSGELSAVMTLGASIGTFAAPSHAPVFRTLYIDDTDSTSFTDYLAIPLRAVRMYPPMVGNAFGGAFGLLQIDFFDVSGHFVTEWKHDYSVDFGVSLQPYVVPPDAFFINLKYSLNNGNIRVPFELSL